MTDGSISATAAASALADSSLSVEVGKTAQAATKPVWYMHAVKLPRCSGCGAKHPLAVSPPYPADVCWSCGAPAAEPCDERYEEAEAVAARPSLLQRLTRLFRKG